MNHTYPFLIIAICTATLATSHMWNRRITPAQVMGVIVGVVVGVVRWAIEIF